MPIQDFNLGGGGSPASVNTAIQSLPAFWSAMDRSAERIGANIRSAMVQDESNKQGSAIAQAVQSSNFPDPSTDPNGTMKALVSLAAKYPLGAQTQAGQLAIQSLGSQAANAMPLAPNPITGAGGPGAPTGGAGTPASGTTTGTTFATPQDVQNYAQTGSLKTGDNGVGLWGDATTSGTGPAVAVPESVLQSQFGPNWKQTARGQTVTVSYNGKTLQAPIKDVGGRGIDLNPDAAAALGIKDPDNFKDKVGYSFSGQGQTQTQGAHGAAPAAPAAAPVDMLGAQYQQVQGQLDAVKTAIARMGPVTGRNKTVVAALQRQQSALEGRADQLTEHMATAATAEDKEKGVQDRFDARRSDVQKAEEDRTELRMQALQLQEQATTDREKANAQLNTNRVINTQRVAVTAQLNSLQNEATGYNRQIMQFQSMINRNQNIIDGTPTGNGQGQMPQDQKAKLQSDTDALKDKLNDLTQKQQSVMGEIQSHRDELTDLQNLKGDNQTGQGSGGTQSFATEQDAQAAAAQGKIKKGDKITVAGVSGTWQ